MVGIQLSPVAGKGKRDFSRTTPHYMYTEKEIYSCFFSLSLFFFRFPWAEAIPRFQRASYCATTFFFGDSASYD